MIVTIREVGYALRLMRRSKGFAAAVIVSTALGVGATASVFSLIDAFLLRPLPVPATDRVVHLAAVTKNNQTGRFSYPEVADIRQRARSFAGVAAAKIIPLGLARSRDEQPRMTAGFLVNGEFFTTLGVSAAVGRAFTAADADAPGRSAVVMISYRTWQTEFGGRADIAGQHIRLNGTDFTIVGVVPESFTGVHPFFQPALYAPDTMIREATGAPADALTDRTARSVELFARLQPGVSIAQARDDLRRVAETIERDHPEANKGRSATVFSQLGYRVAEAPDNLTLSWLFFAVAALVLSIACINVANLLLSTAPSRVRETALRLAIGASRTQLIRQFLTESLVLALAGAGIGVGIAAVCAAFIRSIQVASDLPVQLDARVDARVAVFALAVGTLSGILSGVVPAVRFAGADLNSVLKTTGLRVAGSRGWMRQSLVVVQVAGALVMTILSGLFLQSIRAERVANPGFRIDHVLTMGFDPRIAGYNLDATRAFYTRLLERMRALPGVRHAALGQHIPLGLSSSSTEITIPGYDAGANQQSMPIGSSLVTDDYFEVLGIPLVRGRAFTARDTEQAPPVAVVNEEMARRYWPKRDPLGATIVIQATPAVTAQIVGIVRVSKTRDVGERPQPFLYLPIMQRRDTPMILFVETAGDPAAFASVVRGEVRALDPNVPIFDVRTMAAHFEQNALLGVRLVAQVVTAVGLVGIGLSVLGLYAVIAYAVSRRAREIAIRMAIGATAARVRAMVLGQGLVLSAAGISAGLLLTLAISAWLRELVDGVSPRDPLIYTAATAALLAVTLAATYIPARRASLVDPQAALRAE